MNESSWKHSYFLLILAGLLFPGLGQFYLRHWKKGSFFSLIILPVFFFGWWLTGFESLQQPLPQIKLPCFPGIFFWGISFLSSFFQAEEITSKIFYPSHYELGQICLSVVTLMNVMVFFEALEQLYWKKQTLQEKAVPEVLEKPVEKPVRFWLKKGFFLLTLGIWGSTFYLADDNLKLACCFPLCFLISCVYTGCRFESFPRIWWEAERMYLKLSYSLLFFYLILIFL